MFKNMKIGMKLGLGFGLVILLAVTLGVMSWLKVQEIGAEWNSFETINLRKQAAVSDGFGGLQEGIQSFKNYVLRGGDYADKFGKHMDEIVKATADYRAVGEIDAEEDKLLKQVAEGVANYRKAMEEAVLLKGEGKNSNEIDKAIKSADKVVNQGLKQLFGISAKSIEQESKHLRHIIQTVSQWIVALCIAIFVLGVVAAWFITRAITRPLNEAVGVANQLAGGDLTAKIEMSSKDETGMLLLAMQND